MDARTWRFTFVSPNAVSIFGYPLERWYDEPTFWQDTLLHPPHREWCVDYCSTASGYCRDHAFLYRACAADGRALWIRNVVNVLPDDAGRPALMRGIMEDVTVQMSAPAAVHAQMTDFGAPDLEPARVVLTGEWWDTWGSGRIRLTPGRDDSRRRRQAAERNVRHHGSREPRDQRAPHRRRLSG